MIEFLTKLQGVNDNLIFVDQSLYPDLNILVQFEEPPKKVRDTIVIKNAVIEMDNGVENLVDIVKKMFVEKFKVENLDENSSSITSLNHKTQNIPLPITSRGVFFF